MTLPTFFWTIDPAGNNIQYSAHPSGNISPPAWTTIPNFLLLTAAFSVDIQTTYLTPTSGATVTVIGTLPTGWTFDGATLSYNGTSVNSSSTSIGFSASYNGFYTNSNTFQVQGSGSALSPDTYPPTIPLGINASVIAQTTATIGGYPSADPSPPNFSWNGLAQYNVTVTGAPGSPFTVTTAVGNQPAFVLTDIGSPSPASTLTQTGADLAMTSYGSQLFGTADQCGNAFQQLTGTSWILLCKISAFTNSAEYAVAALSARNSLAANSQNVAMITFPFSQGAGVVFQNRATAGGSSTQTGATANTASPIWLLLTRSGDTYTGSWSTNGNTFSLVGSVTQVMGSTLYVGVSVANENTAGDEVSVTFQQVNLQTLGNWSQNLTGLTAATPYSVFATAQDLAGNVSAAGTFSFSTLASSAGGVGPAFDPYPRYHFHGEGTGGESYFSSGTCACGTTFSVAAGFLNSVVISPYMGYSTNFSALETTWYNNAVANGLKSADGNTYCWYTPQINRQEQANPASTAKGPFMTASLTSANCWLHTVAGATGFTDPNEFDTGEYYYALSSNNTNTFVTTNGISALAGLTMFQAVSKYYLDIYLLGNASTYGEAAVPANTYACGLHSDNWFNDARAGISGANGTWGMGSVIGVGAASAKFIQGAYGLYAAADRANTAAAGRKFTISGKFLVSGNSDLCNQYNNRNSSTFAIDPSKYGVLDRSMAEGYWGTSYGGQDDFGTIVGWESVAWAQSIEVSAVGTYVLICYGLSNNGGAFPSSQSSWTAANWTDARQQQAFTFLNQMCYSPNGTASGGNTSPQGMCLFDEMFQPTAAKPSGSVGWLSQAPLRGSGGTSDPVQVAGTPWVSVGASGIYRRRFLNGWVIWNPPGNGSHALTVGTGTGQITPGLAICQKLNQTSNGGLSGYGDYSTVGHAAGTILTAGMTVTLVDNGAGDGLLLNGGYS